jgi:general secretion pathway protein E
VNKAGAGCAACAKTGFQGVTGIFEVLPFTDPVRAAVARAGTASELEAAARAAGMRPLVAAGASRVASGRVSVAELDRVLRFSDQ